MSLWRKLTGLDPQTIEERRAQENGANLFFGALIGANLGVADQLDTDEYVLLVSVLAGTVVYLQLATVGVRRLYYALSLAFLVGVLWVVLLSPWSGRFFDGPVRPGPQMFWTAMVWIATVGLIHLRPVIGARKPRGPAADG